MEPHDPIQPYPGEAPMSLEVGLAFLALALLIFAYLVFKLVRERQRRDE